MRGLPPRPAAIPTENPRLKPEESSPTRTARLESRTPPHECGGSHHCLFPTPSPNFGELALIQFFPVPPIVFAELGAEVHDLVGKKFIIGQEHDGLVLTLDFGAEAPDVPLHLHRYFSRRIVFVDPEELVGLVRLVV